MFTLIYGLLELLLRKTEYRFLIIGLDNAGKTTTLEKVKETYTGEQALPPERIVPTIGLNIGRVERGRTVSIFWDLGGQAALRALWGKYYDEAHGLLYVVDSEDVERLPESRRVLHEVVRDAALRDAPVLVFANKQDTAHARPLEEIEAELDLEVLRREGRTVVAAKGSALQGSGVREAVDWLLGQAKRR